MTDQSTTLLSRGPRIAGLILAGFLALFALDAFNDSSFVAALPDFAIHLIPSLLVVTVDAFIALAVVYAVIVRGGVDWMVSISGPFLAVGLLFLASCRHRAQRQANL
jgi:hypothetical protein